MSFAFTPKNLKDHLQETEFWFDLILLVLLWLAVFFIPQDLEIFPTIKLSFIVKIVALVSSLEAISFFSILFLGKRAGIMFQGFAGGLVSSTMTFLRFTRNSEMSLFSSHHKTRALLYATIAMLIEGALIIYTLLPSKALLALPFLAQALVLFIFSLMLKLSHSEKEHRQDDLILIKEPIIWKKVFYLSSLIFTLIYLMKVANSALELSLFWSSLVISLFEAHAVLIATLGQYHEQGNLSEMARLLMAILTGNVLSKSYFLLRSKDKVLRNKMLIYLYLSLSVAILVCLFF